MTPATLPRRTARHCRRALRRGSFLQRATRALAEGAVSAQRIGAQRRFTWRWCSMLRAQETARRARV